jgi:hypothetical protein
MISRGHRKDWSLLSCLSGFTLRRSVVIKLGIANRTITAQIHQMIRPCDNQTTSSPDSPLHHLVNALAGRGKGERTVDVEFRNVIQ